MFNKTTKLMRSSGVFSFNKQESQKEKVTEGKRLAPIGLCREEITLLTSMLSIVAIRTERHWQISTVDNTDVFFVNIDSTEGASFLRRYGDQFPMIQYTQKNQHNNIFCLAKPLRARDLIAALSNLSSPAAEVSAQANFNQYLRQFAS
jgi:hypothetical protein